MFSTQGCSYKTGPLSGGTAGTNVPGTDREGPGMAAGTEGWVTCVKHCQEGTIGTVI